MLIVAHDDAPIASLRPPPPARSRRGRTWRQSSPNMEALPADALHCILASLGYRDLLAASSACRHLRTAAAADSELWRNMCWRRWHRSSLNAPLFTLPRQQLDGDQHLRPDYRSLFTSGNGWVAPRFALQRYAGSSPRDELLALQPSIGEDGTTIAVSSRRELRILELGSCPSARLQVLRAANVQQDSGQESWISVASIGSEGLVAAGGASGCLAAFQLPEAASGAPSPHSVAATATLAAPGNRQVPLCGRLQQLAGASSRWRS